MQGYVVGAAQDLPALYTHSITSPYAFPHRTGVDRMPEQPRTWHYGLMAQWWAEFNIGGSEIAYFHYIQVATGRLYWT